VIEQGCDSLLGIVVQSFERLPAFIEGNFGIGFIHIELVQYQSK
jgi:hypothetical protein